jgi:hypothetical protein
MTVEEVLDLIDDTSWNDDEFKGLLEDLNEEISKLKIPDKSIIVDKTEDATIHMEIKDGKGIIVITKPLPSPLNVCIEFEGPNTSISVIRKYVTRENIEALLFPPLY